MEPSPGHHDLQSVKGRSYLRMGPTIESLHRADQISDRDSETRPGRSDCCHQRILNGAIGINRSHELAGEYLIHIFYFASPDKQCGDLGRYTSCPPTFQHSNSLQDS